jgi:hypothetical protein
MKALHDQVAADAAAGQPVSPETVARFKVVADMADALAAANAPPAPATPATPPAPATPPTDPAATPPTGTP